MNVLILVGFVLSSIEYNYLIVKKLSSDLYVYQNNIAKINKKKKSDNLKKIDNITVTDNIYGGKKNQIKI